MQNTQFREDLFTAGLCTTCRSAPLCTFPRRSETPVRECEEFDGALRAPAAAAPRAVPRKRETGREEAAAGLCGWCDRRAVCTFPRGAGGTWFCEEYE